MNQTIYCSPLSPGPQLDALRNEYLDTLSDAQELLLEVLVTSAQAFLLQTRHGKICGYALVHDKHTLLEFHLHAEHWVFGETSLQQLIKTLGLQRAWVKSFDSLLLSSALAQHTSLRNMGLLVRDYVPRALPNSSRFPYTSRVANQQDLQRLLAVDQQVFTVQERLEHVLSLGQMRIFEQGTFTVGFGILRPVVEGRRDVDVSIAIDRPFRGRGYATFVFRDLVEECLTAGYRPICGCASANQASRHLGERIGMIARHRLLELRF